MQCKGVRKVVRIILENAHRLRVGNNKAVGRPEGAHQYLASQPACPPSDARGPEIPGDPATSANQSASNGNRSSRESGEGAKQPQQQPRTSEDMPFGANCRDVLVLGHMTFIPSTSRPFLSSSPFSPLSHPHSAASSFRFLSPIILCSRFNHCHSPPWLQE